MTTEVIIPSRGTRVISPQRQRMIEDMLVRNFVEKTRSVSPR